MRAAGAERAFMEHLYCDRMKTAFGFLYTNRYRFYICICIYIYVPPGSSLLNTMPNRNIYTHIHVYINFPKIHKTAFIMFPMNM